MKKCTYCGREYPDEASFCTNDQSLLKEVAGKRPARVTANLNPVPKLPPLPLKISRRASLFSAMKEWLVITEEGLAIQDGELPALLRWNEIIRMNLIGRGMPGISIGASWHLLTIYLNGFESFPISINVINSQRHPKELFEILSSVCNAFRRDRTVPPFGRAFPKLSKALEALPLRIGFPKAASKRGVMTGLIIFFLLFVVPVIACTIADGPYRAAKGVSFLADVGQTAIPLSLFGMLGLGMTAVYGRRFVCRSPVLILKEDGFLYNRGRKHLAMDGNQITDLQFKPGSRTLAVYSSGKPKRPARLKLHGLDFAPREIVLMLQYLARGRWTTRMEKY